MLCVSNVIFFFYGIERPDLYLISGNWHLIRAYRNLLKRCGMHYHPQSERIYQDTLGLAHIQTSTVTLEYSY